MIAECIAVYAEDLRFVQVSAVVQTNAGVSLHRQLRTASVKLLYNATSFLTKTLTEQDYNIDEQAFYVFFLNPPVERNMFVVLEVETIDDETAKVRAPVRMATTLQYKEMATNPMLGGKQVLDYKSSTDGLNGVRTPL